MRRYGAAVILGALLVTSACGGDEDRPSVEEVSTALRKGGDDSILGAAGANLDKKAADCIAEVLVESKVSDTTLDKVVGAEGDYKPSKSDEAALAKVGPKLVECVSKR